MDFKNLKIVRKLKDISPKLKWAMFSGLQDFKIASRYIDYIIPDNRKKIASDNEKIEKMVRDTLIKEFSPEIQKMKSFDLLVDATVHKLKQKQLEAMGEVEEIEL
ncbi:hypothetical protein IJ670_01505 [bacterium]|nr:hypothetical protein [bacterium]